MYGGGGGDPVSGSVSWASFFITKQFEKYGSKIQKFVVSSAISSM